MRDMLGREELISVERALELLLSYAPYKMPDKIVLPLDESYGLITSEDIIAPEDLPSFNRSTVDGFAVNSADTFGATENLPSYLNIKAEILMGEEPKFKLQKGEVAKISTGGMLPEGADSVIMFEHIQFIDENMIEVLKPVSPMENVIHIGEDARKGEYIFKSGHRLRPQDIGALAGLGITEVQVYKKPIVSIITTGDEIVPPDQPLRLGQVRDINSYTLTGLILDKGAVPIKKGLFLITMRLLKML